MNIENILTYLNDHTIFTYFWSDKLLQQLMSNVKMCFIPHEYISYYQNKSVIPLHNIGKTEDLNGLTAQAIVTFTSDSENWNTDKAILEIDTPSVQCAILIKVEVFNLDNNMIISIEFNLGSKKKESICIYGDNLKCLSLLL